MYQIMPVSVTAIQGRQHRTIYAAEYLLVLTLTGGCRSQENGQPIGEGRVLFLPPSESRHLRLGEKDSVICAYIPVELWDTTAGSGGGAAVMLSEEASPDVIELLIELFDLQHNRRNVSALTIASASYRLLSALESALPVGGGELRDLVHSDGRGRRMMAYVGQHFREPIQLEDLANAFSLSRQHCSTSFHQEIGISFSEYLLSLRLGEAMRLLMTTNMSVTFIAEKSGFPSLKALNKAFRSNFGCSPRAYREQARQSPAGNGQISGTVLESVNRLLSPYRPVYEKSEETIRIHETVDIAQSAEFQPRWNDILNIDNPEECLQGATQQVLRSLQEEMRFRYVRISNCLSHSMTPFLASSGTHRYTNFLRLMEFFRSIDLTPMLALGNSYEVMSDSLMINHFAYSTGTEDWYRYLEELLEISIKYFGPEWVSTWRLEFHMPESLYNSSDHSVFLELFERSLSIIRRISPEIQVGGPAMSVDNRRMPRWHSFFAFLRDKNLKVDFISGELFADYEFKEGGFPGQFQEWKEVRTISRLISADVDLIRQKTLLLREQMNQYGYKDTPLLISALGVTKYQAMAAQVGGHCGAYLVKCILSIHDLVDGIGCWKALNDEVEFGDEFQVFGNGCGLLGRYDMKSCAWYAYSFLAKLLPMRVFQGISGFVTTNEGGEISIILQNCKNYSRYFCGKYLTAEGLEYANPKFYTNNAALSQTFTIQGTSAGYYVVKQYLVGNHHGNPAAVMQRMGRIGHLSAEQIQYVAGQSLPYQHTYILTRENDLTLTVTLQPNETMLLLLTPGI